MQKIEWLILMGMFSRSDRARRVAKERLNAGCCVRCGQKKELDGLKTCEYCRIKRRKITDKIKGVF